ncbi:VanZ family protein [Sulfitobacter sp. SH24]|uniref:VanZ family protein n=1 Tax=Sulfitobacter sp. SH24 TaxID=3421173 RepID=UPI003F50773C
MVDLQMVSLNHHRRRSIASWLTFGLSVCIAVLTLIPSNAGPHVPGGDKVHHVLAFMALTLPSAVFYPKALVRVVLAAALYAGLIEIIQPFVGRSGEIADFLADLLGIAIGAMIGLLLHWGSRCLLSSQR